MFKVHSFSPRRPSFPTLVRTQSRVLVAHTFNNLVNKHAHDHHSVAVVNNSSLFFCISTFSSPHVQGLPARIPAWPIAGLSQPSQAVTRVVRGLWWGKTSAVQVEFEFLSCRACLVTCRASVTKVARRPIDSAIKLHGSGAREWAWPLTKCVELL